MTCRSALPSPRTANACSPPISTPEAPPGRLPRAHASAPSAPIPCRIPRMSRQGEFHFDPEASEDGYGRWLLGRRMAVEILARKMNLPLGHEVEIWLFGGVRLRGVLRLKEEALFIEEERFRHLELKVEKVA